MQQILEGACQTIQWSDRLSSESVPNSSETPNFLKVLFLPFKNIFPLFSIALLQKYSNFPIYDK